MSGRGGVKIFEGRVYARVRYGKKDRLEERLPWATPEMRPAALERSQLIASLCDQLVASGRRDLVRNTAKEAAATTSTVVLATIQKAVAALTKTKGGQSATTLTTFKDVAEMWTSGELRKKHPDYVRPRASFALETGRLRRYIYPHIKDVPIVAFEKAHADIVMAKLPARRIKTSSARRHIAQIVSRVLNLAVMPLGLIKASPLPRGWLPRIVRSRHYTCLFPQEEKTFLGCAQIDEAFRLFIGILDREGMRVSELADCDWWQWNTDVGTFTATKTKGGDPRMWAVRKDVACAMRMWKERYGKTKARPFSDVFAEKDAKLYLAGHLRDGLAAAGVTRKELFESTEFTGKLRTHDMRATFVTISLAEGKTDTWIRDRTGHKTLGMVDRYRRTARQFVELDQGSLVDLVQGLGWVISRVILDVAVGDETSLSAEDPEWFRRTDSNCRKRNQNSTRRIRALPAAAKDGRSDVGDSAPRAGSPTDPPGLRRLPNDVQTFVANRLAEAFKHIFDGSEGKSAVLAPLARAARAIERGHAPKRKPRTA